MKYIFSSTITLFFLFHSALSQNQPNTVLWSIKKQNLKTSFFLGTDHSLDGKIFINKFPIVLKKITECEAFVSEIDSDTEEGLDYQRLYYEGDTTNSQMLSKEDYNLIMNYFRSTTDGIDSGFLFKLEKGRPILLHIAFIESLENNKKDSQATQEPVIERDTYLENIAKENNKEILALENSGERTNALMHSISDKKILDKVIREIRSENKKSDETFPKHDNDPYAELLKKDYFFNSWGNDFGGVKERNLLWISRLENMMNKKSCFIAVGSGHLVGKYGLITMLRKKGYTIKPIKMN